MTIRICPYLELGLPPGGRGGRELSAWVVVECRSGRSTSTIPRARTVLAVNCSALKGPGWIGARVEGQTQTSLGAAGPRCRRVAC